MDFSWGCVPSHVITTTTLSAATWGGGGGGIRGTREELHDCVRVWVCMCKCACACVGVQCGCACVGVQVCGLCVHPYLNALAREANFFRHFYQKLDCQLCMVMMFMNSPSNCNFRMQLSPYAALVCSVPEMVGILRNSRNLVTAGSSPSSPSPPSPPSPAERSLLRAGGSDISLLLGGTNQLTACITSKWAELG